MAREDAHKPGALGKEARLAKIGMKYGGKRKKKSAFIGEVDVATKQSASTKMRELKPFRYRTPSD